MPQVMRWDRVDASLEQEAILREWAGCPRLVWNLALEQRCVAWDSTNAALSTVAGRPNLAGLRDVMPRVDRVASRVARLAAVPSRHCSKSCATLTSHSSASSWGWLPTRAQAQH
jgi:Helix-turn-helix domain